MSRRKGERTMTLVDLAELLDAEAPFPDPEPGEDELAYYERYKRVADERALIGAEYGFSRLDVLRTRLAHLWGY